MIRSLVATLVIAVSATASAQPAGAQAEVLFRQGRDLMAAGKFAEACEALQASQKLQAAPTTLLNLAGCREKLGQLATAWGLFLEAERATRSVSDAATKQLHDIAATRVTTLEPRLSKLAINVAADSHIDGLEITRGDERVDEALWNHALPIDGGTYTITAHAPNNATWSATVEIATESDSKTIEIPKLQGTVTAPAVVRPTDKPPVKPVEPQAVAPLRTQPNRRIAIVPVVVGGGAIALGIVALAFEMSGSQTYAEAKAETSSQTHRDSLYSSANGAHPVAGVFAVAGIAAAGTTAWLIVRDHNREMPSPYVFAGGAVVLAVTALTFNLWAGSAYDDAKRETTNQLRRDALYDGANNKRYAAAGVATAAIACGGIAVWRFARGRRAESTVVVAPTGIAMNGRF